MPVAYELVISGIRHVSGGEMGISNRFKYDIENLDLAELAGLAKMQV